MIFSVPSRDRLKYIQEMGPLALHLLAFALVATPIIAWGAGINVQWTGADEGVAEQQGYLEHVRKSSSSALSSVTRALALRPSASIAVHVYDGIAYSKKFGRLAGDRHAAHYSRGAIHVNAGWPIGRQFEGLMRHEMTHAVLDHEGHSRRLPRWLNEGVAELLENGVQSGEFDPVRRLYLKDAERDDELSELAGFPYPMDSTEYLYAYFTVCRLMNEHGQQALADALAAILEGTTPDKALQDHFQRDQARIDAWMRKWISDYDG